jgi:hypothetical protein
MRGIKVEAIYHKLDLTDFELVDCGRCGGVADSIPQPPVSAFAGIVDRHDQRPASTSPTSPDSANAGQCHHSQGAE